VQTCALPISRCLLISSCSPRYSARLLLQGNVDNEVRVARLADAFHQALMLADDALGDGQPQSGTFGAAADHGVEHAFQQAVGNSRAVVDDVHPQGQAVSPVADGYLTQGSGAQGDTLVVRLLLVEKGLHGITGNIEKRLDQLFLVALELRDAGVVVALDLDTAFALCRNQSADPLQHFVNIDGCQAKRLVGAEHPIHKITQPVGLFNDDAGVVMQVVVHQLPVEQLCRTTDAAQRVLDLMGKTSDQHAGGFLVG